MVEPVVDASFVDVALKEAEHLRSLGDESKARRLLQQTLFRCKSTDRENIAKILSFLVDIETEGTDPGQPVKAVQPPKATPAQQSETQIKERVLMLERMAQMAKSLGKIDEARRCYASAAQTVAALGDPKVQARMLKSRAVLERDEGNNETALRLYQEAADVYQSIGDAMGQGKALQAKGSLLQKLGRNRESREIHQKAADLCGESNDSRDEASMQAGLGDLMLQMKNWDAARGAFEASWILSVKAKSLPAESRAVQGLIHAVSVDYPEAAKILKNYYNYLMTGDTKDERLLTVAREEAMVVLKT